MADSDLVFPGDEVAVEEEYIASDGTFAENGVIYASLMGKKFVRFKRRTGAIVLTMAL